MRGSILLVRRDHEWLHTFLRLLVVLLLILLFAWLTEAAAKHPTQQRQLTKDEIREIEQRLAELGYWTGPVDGALDDVSQHALIAFQKVESRKRTGKLNREELEAIRAAASPEPRDKTFAHIEVDIDRQVLFIVDDQGKVTKILPVCTGSEQHYVDGGRVQHAHTPRGAFTVLRKIAGWRRSRLGLLYYPNYIHNGIAIHGSPSMPATPASHGCIRIPMFAAKDMAQLTPVGTVVVVYD